MSFIQTVQKITMCNFFLKIVMSSSQLSVSGNLLIRMSQVNMPTYHLLQ